MPPEQPAKIESDANAARPQPCPGEVGGKPRAYEAATPAGDESEPVSVCITTGDAKPSAPALPMPRWLFNLIGHTIAGVLGLILGYLILHALRPEAFPYPW